MTGRPCQCALAVFHKNVSNPTQNVEDAIKKDAAALQRPLNREDDLEWPPLIGLRHPASASCLGRHSRLAGRCPNNSSLFPPLAAVVVVASHIQRKIIFYFGFQESLRTFLKPFFTGRVWNELPQSKPDGFDSSLWEGASGIAVKFPAQTQRLR